MAREWLKELRESRRLNQTKAAEFVRVERSYYSKIENGRRPSVPVAKKIAEAFDFDWTRFFEDESA